MKIIVGSKNPIKIAATKEAFSHFFTNIEVEGVHVNSKVSEQPIGKETYLGARNRALSLSEYDADYYVGLEGGIEKIHNQWYAFGIMHIIDKTGKESTGKTPFYQLPTSIVNRVLAGEELGPIIDSISNDQNCKQKGGAISYFTKGILNRKQLYIQGMLMALIPFLRKDLYFQQK